MDIPEDGKIKNLSTDCVIFGFSDETLKILLIKLAAEPEKGEWALPGNIIMRQENLDDAAKRVLKELTGLEKVFMEQVHTFGNVNRFPLFRIITVAYYALINPDKYHPEAGGRTSDVRWFPIEDLPDLAFDHNKILDYALNKLQRKIRFEPIGFELLPKKFTLTQLQSLYEAINGVKLDKRNFRRKILNMGMVIELDEYKEGVPYRPPQLYKFDKAKYDKLKETGFTFELKVQDISD